MYKHTTKHLSNIFSCKALTVFSSFFLAIFFCCTSTDTHATVWKTSTAGPVTTLGNWSNGVSAPTTFATPGDSWIVTLSMTMPSPGTWTLGASGPTPDTLNITTGGTIGMSGAGSTSTVTLYGDLIIGGGTFTLGGAGTTATINVHGDTYINTGTMSSTGASSALTVNVSGNVNMTAGTMTTAGAASGIFALVVNGNFSMTGGTINANGASSTASVKILGNGSFSGTSAMTNTGAGCTSVAHFSLPSGSGTMMIDNTSTGSWSATNVYVDTGCTAQLDGNFSTTTGSATYGLTVSGKLICPASYLVNGAGKFILNGVATLEAANTAGINGAITTTGTRSFSTSANYVFNGTAAQVTGTYLPSSLISPDTITINNTAGVTLSQITATTGKLIFNSGILNTGLNTITVPGAATAVIGAGATSYVNGTLFKTISGFTNLNYEVGDINYAPVSLVLSSAGTAGTIGAQATSGLHPSVATSGLATGNMVNHYWLLTTTLAAGPTTVTPTFTYNGGDILGGSNLMFVAQEYSGAWLGTPLPSANTVSPYTSTIGVGVPLSTLEGDYIFGNKFCGTLPITGTTTLCTITTSTLSDATAGGTWASSTTTIAKVGSTGIVTGVSAGTASISYTNAGCMVLTTVTVSSCSALTVNSSTQQENAALTVFPNPSTGTFTINLSSENNEEVEIVITNITGRQVSEFITTANKATDVHLDPVPGIYLLSATTAHNRYIAKVVVQ